MGITYNIPLDGCFLMEAAALIKEKKADNKCCYKIFLPNFRSCREFRKHVLSFAENSTFLPEIRAISEFLALDEQKIIFLLMNIIKNKNQYIPINTICDLSESLYFLLKELILNNINYHQINEAVFKNLPEHSRHIIEILDNIINAKEILKILEVSKAKILNFIESTKHQEIIAIGIGDANYYTRLFLENVISSKNGIVVIFGSESLNYKNHEINRRILNSIMDSKTSKIDLNSEILVNWKKKFPQKRTNPIAIEEFESKSDEAFAIALMARKAVFEKQSVLIVSQDQNLTKKIKSELLRWNICADDSMGRFFSQIPSGIIMASIMEMLLNRCNTVTFLNLLKLSRQFCKTTQKLEEFFRRQQIVPSDFFVAFNLWNEKEENFEFWEIIKKIQEVQINIDAKQAFMEWLKNCESIFSLINPENLLQFSTILRGILRHSELLPEMNFNEFCIFFRNRVLSQKIREAREYTDGVIILGAIEAQLLDADLVIIAGANEKSWSISEKNDFWLTKSMLKRLNILNAEAKNEFLHGILERLLHKNRVLITRSEIVDGEKQQRCKYLEKLMEIPACKTSNMFKRLIRNIEKSQKREIIKFEKPSPGLHYRLQKIWASDIDLLSNNPYAFYAKKILKLSEMDYINEARNIHGNYLHRVLEEFVKYSSNKTNLDELNYFAKKVLKDKLLTPSDLGLWFFKTRKIFSFIVANMNNNVQYLAETQGEFRLQISPHHQVNICCRADRIDIAEDGFLSIIDYKTGELPSSAQMEKGSKLQLPVEGLVAKNDGFKLENTKIGALSFWKLGGFNGGEEKIIINGIEKMEKMCDQTCEKLKKLLNKYNALDAQYDVNIDCPYEKAYMHLARVKEWSNE